MSDSDPDYDDAMDARQHSPYYSDDSDDSDDGDDGRSSKKQKLKHNAKSNHVEIDLVDSDDDFSSEFKDTYLADYATSPTTSYVTLQDAKDACIKKKHNVGGITKEKDGVFTLRVGRILHPSPLGETSWIFLPELSRKATSAASSSGAALITILCADKFSISLGSLGGVYVVNFDPSSK